MKITGLLLAAALAATACAGACAQTPPGGPPLRMDLDRFDASKRVAHLPNAIDLSYIDMGNPSGRPVMLVHGYTDNARDWVPLIPELPSSWRLIVVDIRGHGGSSKPECCYSRHDFAYDLKLLLDALRIDQVDFVGHSLGSIIGQTFAENWPERARRLVLLSSTGGPRPGSTQAPALAGYATEIRKLREPIDPDSPFMVQWWSSPTPVNEDFLRRQRIDSARIPLQVWLAVIDQGLNLADLQATLARIQAPTLLVWGERDPIMVEEDRATLREALPKAKVVVYPGLGHNPFWEQPELVAGTLKDFLGP